MPVVEDDDELRCVGEFAHEERHQRVGDRTRTTHQRVERRLPDGRVHLAQAGHQVRPQAGRVGVGRIECQPDERRPLAIGIDPLREQRRLPVARGSADEGERAPSTLP